MFARKTGCHETLLEQNVAEDLVKEKKKEYQYERSFQLGRFKGQDMAIRKELAKLKSGPAPVPTKDPRKNAEKKLSIFSRERWAKLFKFVLEDWIFLALLGFIMAFCSFTLDYLIVKLQDLQMFLFQTARSNLHISAAYFIWVFHVVILAMTSAVCVHYIAVQAIGSGIPEMKTILRGVILKEYLSFRTLISKMIGLVFALGSGLPMGKEGPFVHIASVVANQLSKFVHSGGAFENESRSNEMLAAGCAVGVACTFSAPVGGVLFSIEVTAVYFAVRDYWRGFFAAICSATLFRLLGMIGNSDELASVEAHYQTHFPEKDAYLATELPFFALIGLCCGIFGALFVYMHRYFVLMLRRNWLAKKLFHNHWPVYPIFVTILISSITFPMGFGAFIGGEQKFGHTLGEFFSSCTWTASANHSTSCPDLNEVRADETAVDLSHWTGPNGNTSVLTTLTLFQITYFLLSIIASTLPIPAGIFMPVLGLGAAFGRSCGEMLALYFPDGLYPHTVTVIYPGVYAVVGAAAFCGAVTHTVSVAVIVFELTGQVTHILPVMIAVLVANAVASYLQPSIYDSIIKIKHLPYLPDIPPTTSAFHQISVENFMVSPVRYIANDSTYEELQCLLADMPRLRAFPLVQSNATGTLLGSVSSLQLAKILDDKVGIRARRTEAAERVKAAISIVNQRFKLGKDELDRKLSIDQESLDDGNGNAEKIDMPTKSLKRFTVVPVSGEAEVVKATTICADAGKILSLEEKEAIFAMGKKRALTENIPESEHHHRSIDVYHTIGGMFRSITKMSFGRQKPKLTKEDDFDLQGEERRQWEHRMLEEVIDLENVRVDSAPFQLVTHTSLFKVHSIFTLLGMDRAYVTESGKLLGVVTRKELRKAIEEAQTGITTEDFDVGYPEMSKDSQSIDIDFLCPKLEVVKTGQTDKFIRFDPVSVQDNSYQNRPEPLLLGESGRKNTVSSSNSDPCIGNFHTTIVQEIPEELNTTLSTQSSNLRSSSIDSKSSLTTDDLQSIMSNDENRRSRRKKKDLHVQILMPDIDSPE